MGGLLTAGKINYQATAASDMTPVKRRLAAFQEKREEMWQQISLQIPDYLNADRHV